MKLTDTTLALFVAVLALPMAAIGKDKGASTEMASNDAAIEDIVVVGQKSKGALRRELYRSEEDFYSVYNKLNDEGEYDVRCFYETPTGTHVKNHVCRAKFVTSAYTRHAARNGGDLTRIAGQDADPVFAEKMAKYQAKLESLIATHPELQAALVRYSSAQAQFMAKLEEKRQ